MLNFKEFKSGICPNCSLCKAAASNYSKSNFCFEVYKKNPALFMSFSYQKLKATFSWPLAYALEKELFENIFCKSKICGELEGFTCAKLHECTNVFAAQMRIYRAQRISVDNLKLVVKVPKPFIIAGGSAKWVKTVKKME